jgi:hypothetical protein
MPTSSKRLESNVHQHNATTKTLVKSNPTVKVKPKPKALPKPTWTAVHTTLNLSQAQDRFLIREFSLRFSILADNLARSHFEELSEIAGRGKGPTEDEEDREEEWVSEACVKAVVLLLLELIASGVDQRPEKVGLFESLSF